MLLDMYTCKEVAHCAYVGKVLNRLETEGGQVEQRVSLWMMVADENENISCGQAIYLQPSLSPHLPPIIPTLLMSQTIQDWLVIITIFLCPMGLWDS